MSVTIGMEYSCKCLGIDRAVNPLQLCILCPQISMTLSPEVVLFIFDGPDSTRSQFVNNQLVESCQLEIGNPSGKKGDCNKNFTNLHL